MGKTNSYWRTLANLTKRFTSGALSLAIAFSGLAAAAPLFFTQTAFAAGSGMVSINEVMPNPAAGSSEWVELYYPGITDVHLKDWYVKDAAGHQFKFSDGAHLNNGDHYTTIDVSNLNNDGDTVTLYDNNDTVVDTLAYTQDFTNRVGQSFGRTTDGGNTLQVFATPTKDASNNPTPSYTYDFTVNSDQSFTKGQAEQFDVTTTTTDPAGNNAPMVRAYFNDNGANGTYEYKAANGTFLPFNGTQGFGPAAGFEFTNGATSTFRATYQTAGSFTSHVEFREVGTNDVIAEKDVPFTVAAGAVENIRTGETFTDIQSALADSDTHDGDTIALNTDITTPSRVLITHPIVLAGNGHTISPTNSVTSSVIDIIGTHGVTLSNLTVDGANGFKLRGINVYESSAFLDSVTTKNNYKAGLVVNGSTVTVNNITTANNGWDGINVDQGSGVLSTASLTVNGTSTHNEFGNANDIYVDDTSKDVHVIDTNHQYFISHPNKDGTNPNDRAYNLDHSNLVVDVTYPTNNSVIRTPNHKLVVTGNFSATLNGANYIQTQLVYKGNDKGVITKYGTITNGTFAEFDTTNLPDSSEYYIAVTGTDTAGNVSTRHIVNFTLDNTAPTGIATYNGGHEISDVIYLKSINDLTFNVALADTQGLEHTSYAVWKADSNFGNRTLFCGNWNHAVTSVNVSGTSASVGGNVKDCSPTGDWSDGNYVIEHVVYDTAGNLTYFNTPYPGQKFVIDSSIPTSNVTSATQTSVNTVSFSGNVSDTNLNYYYCYLTTTQTVTVNGHTYTPGQEVGTRNSNCQTTWATGKTSFSGQLGSFNTSGLPSGNYTINLVAYDLATNNNSAKPATFVVAVDHNAPLGSITAIGGSTYSTSGTTAKLTNGKLTVTGTVKDETAMNRVGVQLVKPGVSGDIQYVYANGNHMYGQIGQINWSAEFNNSEVASLKDGTYGINLYYVDKVGNVATQKISFTLDNTAPVAEITAPTAATSNLSGLVTVSGTVSDVNPDHYYSVVKDSNGKVVAGPGTVNQAVVSDWSWDTTKVRDGVYTIDLEARDQAGNKGALSTDTLKVTVYNNVPSVTAQDFGTGTWTKAHDGFTGINVGFLLGNFHSINNITVDLYNADGIFVTNTASADMLDEINTNTNGFSLNGQVSSPFVVDGVLNDTYCGGSACWTTSNHTWTSKDLPVKAVITVYGVNDLGQAVTVPVENTSFTQTVGASFTSLLPVAKNTAKASVTATPQSLQGNTSGTQGSTTQNQTFAAGSVASAAIDSATSSVLGAEGQSDTMSGSTDNNATKELKNAKATTCAKLLGVCWYYWIPIVLIVGYIVYRYFRSADENQTSAGRR